MNRSDPGHGELKSTGYEIFIGILSLLSIVNIVLSYAIKDANLNSVLDVMNVLFSVIFLIDFTYRFLTAESKSHYFFRGFGWADLLASLPFEQLKILRVFRLARVFRLLRAYGAKNIARSLIADRAGSALFTLLLMGILLLEFGSLQILNLEQHAPGANITTGPDAIWYVIVTISTVGYGDQYPVTGRGRWFGSLIIIIGVGIFGTFTGYLANFFLAPSKESAVEPAPQTDVGVQVSALRELMADQHDEQRAAIDEIERLLASEGGTAGPADG